MSTCLAIGLLGAIGGVLLILFRKPVARFSIAMQNRTWGLKFGDDVVRRTQNFIIPVVGAFAILLGLAIATILPCRQA